MKQVIGNYSKHPPAAWMVLAVSLIVTGWAWFVASAAVQQRASERFEFTAGDVASAITERMDEYELALRSGLALFHASETVSRKEWQDFADTLYLNKHFPGIQGLGYSVMLDPEQVASHESAIRDQGFDDYQIRPQGIRDQYSAIVYLEPFDWRNQRAFGYDMFSEPTRREAMERARDTADFAASGRVTLVQETEQNVQFGFLMYLPFYKKNSPLTYIEDRRQAIQGFVYAAFRIGDLMSGVLGSAQQNVNFELYEGKPEQGAMLYNNAPDNKIHYNSPGSEESFNAVHKFDVGGQTWSLYVYSDTGFIPASELHQPTFIVVTGILLDIFLFFLISYLATGRNQAKVSEQRAIADFQNSQQRLQLAADAGNMGLAEWNIVEGKLYWDDRMLALYGYTRDTFGDGIVAWQQRVHPDDQSEVVKQVEGARQFKQHFDMQFRIILPGKEIRHIAASIIVERNMTGQAVRMVGFHYDVTEQHQAKQQLKTERWRLRNVLEATHAGTWEWNVKTGETQFNSRWAEIIGYSLDELSLVSIKNWMTITHPDDLEQSHHKMQLHFAGITDYYECVCRIKHKDGHWVWVKGRGKVFTWTDDGKPLMMFGTHHDISEQKRVEAILKTERDNAESANRSRGEFLANMSHEIRTPINGVVGAINLLADTPLSASQHNLLNISKRSAESLLGLINDILDLSKMESGKLEIIEEEVALASTINDVARSLSAKAESKHIELLCPAHYIEDVSVMVDGLRLRQILTNLMNNAIKFTEQGSVKLSVEELKQTQGRLRLRFNVTDTGQGIAPDKQALLFKRFQQVDSSLTRREGGSGLGLSISKQLVELMGGTIGVESEVGKGSKFWFELEFLKATKNQPIKRRTFNDMQVCALKPGSLYQHFYESVFSAWNIVHTHTDDYSQALETLTSSTCPNKVLIVDAMHLSDKTLMANLMATTDKLSNIYLLVVCPQSMLTMIPQVVSDQADQIISKPLMQSELYNGLLSVVAENDDEIIQDQSTNVEPYKQFDAKVLVVEDNITNIAIIQGLLKKFNVTTDVAENGQQALNLLAKNNYDLVLMDCQMPVMDGYETTRTIRKTDADVLDRDVPIIALTAQAMRGDEAACREAGMNDYLSKPIEPRLLYDKLSKWLPEKCKQQLAS